MSLNVSLKWWIDNGYLPDPNSPIRNITMISTIKCATSGFYSPYIGVQIKYNSVNVIDVYSEGAYQTSASSDTVGTYTNSDDNITIKVRFKAEFGNPKVQYVYISINDCTEQQFSIGSFNINMKETTQTLSGTINQNGSEYSVSLS